MLAQVENALEVTFEKRSHLLTTKQKRRHGRAEDKTSCLYQKKVTNQTP